MVVVVILGVLATVAVPALRASTYGAGANGFANQIDALLDEARMRAVSSRRWQRLVVLAREVRLEEAATTGMDVPTTWRDVRSLPTPSSVEIVALDFVSRLDPGPAPTMGDNLGQDLRLSPDGSATSATIYVQRRGGGEPTRLTLVRATSASFIYSGW
jgi:Tfp pilus assembly protein FimT